jgi:hypothetical protein
MKDFIVRSLWWHLRSQSNPTRFAFSPHPRTEQRGRSGDKSVAGPAAIHRFADEYPAARVVVTSRIIGYQHQALASGGSEKS